MSFMLIDVRREPPRGEACPAAERHRKEHETHDEDEAKHRRLRCGVQQSGDPLLGRIDPTHHRERVEQRAEREQHGERRQIRLSREAADRGAQAIVGQLLARHPETDGDVVVRTRLHAVQAEWAPRFTTFDGRNSASSQPRWRILAGMAVSRRPLMQSTVAQLWHTAGSRTASSSGDSVDSAKLN